MSTSFVFFSKSHSPMARQTRLHLSAERFLCWSIDWTVFIWDRRFGPLYFVPYILRWQVYPWRKVWSPIGTLLIHEVRLVTERVSQNSHMIHGESPVTPHFASLLNESHTSGLLSENCKLTNIWVSCNGLISRYYSEWIVRRQSYFTRTAHSLLPRAAQLSSRTTTTQICTFLVYV